MSLKDKKLKPSKRVRSALKNLHEIAELLNYFLTKDGEYSKIIREKLEPIEDLLIELAVDKKLDHIRLKQKLDIVENIKRKQEDRVDRN